MSQYIKIHSLYKREGYDFSKTGIKPNGNQLIEGEYACPEFGNVKQWIVEEKVDGANVRVIYKEGEVSFGGRTDNAQMPTSLLTYLQDTFSSAQMAEIFTSDGEGRYPSIVLYGEG